MDRNLALTRYNYRHNNGVTLIELLIAISIFILIAAAFSNIGFFSRHQVIGSDRQMKLQNEAAYALEHMVREIGKAIGDAVNIPVAIDDSNLRIKFYVDTDTTGQWPGDGYISAAGGDRWRAYRYRNSLAPAGEQYQIWYCPECTDDTCDTCSPGWGTPDNNILSKKISSFTPSYSSDNDYVEIQLSLCWDPDEDPDACGTVENPSLTMKNRIYMPGVSTD